MDDQKLELGLQLLFAKPSRAHAKLENRHYSVRHQNLTLGYTAVPLPIIWAIKLKTRCGLSCMTPVVSINPLHREI